MTISSEIWRDQYTSTGTTGYDYTFPIFADADLAVYSTDLAGVETLLTLTTDYTVSGAGVPAGGRASLVAAPPAGYLVTLIRDVAYTQETDYRRVGSLDQEQIERDFDKLCMLVQQQQEQLGRAFKVSVGSVSSASPDAYMSALAAHVAVAETAASASSAFATSAAVAAIAALFAQTSAEAAAVDAWLAESGAAAAVASALASLEWGTVRSRARFARSAATVLQINPGIYRIPTLADDLYWHAPIEFTVGSGGSNTDSGPLVGSGFNILWFDASTISSGEITAVNFVNNSATPVWNGSAKAYMNGDDVAAFGFYSSGGAIATIFHTGGERVYFGSQITILTGLDIDLVWTDVTLLMPACCREALVVGETVTATAAVASWRPNGATGNGHILFGGTSTFIPAQVFTDSSGKIEVVMNKSDASNIYLYQIGYTLPEGM